MAAINHASLGGFGPVVDGTFLPDLPSVLFAQGRFAAVDFVGGHCTNDGRTFVGGTPADFVTDADIIARVFSRWGNQVVSVGYYLCFEEAVRGAYGVSVAVALDGGAQAAGAAAVPCAERDGKPVRDTV